MKIRAEHLTKTVSLPMAKTLTILQDVSLNIDTGDILGILGVSGSGKSTLLGLLAGLDLPTQGRVFWNDTSLNELNEDGRARLRLHHAGFIFQNFELLPAYTALENVLLPLELIGQTDATSKAKLCLKEVELSARMHHYPNQLSGGEQQRVAIARAFAIQPSILFADEPTGNLDQKTGSHIIELLFELNQRHKTTLVFVTHDPTLSKICSKILHLSEGKLEA